MLSEPKVLIIEADPDTGKELQAILKFISYNPVSVENAAGWKEHASETNEIQAVLVGPTTSEQQLSNLLSDIHNHDEHLPIYLLSPKGREPTVTIDPGSCILGRLELPPNYAQLTSALHQAEIYTESHRGTAVSQRPV